MRAFAVLAVAVLAATLLGPIAAPAPLVTTPGDSVQVVSGTQVLEKPVLLAQEASGIRPGPHKILFSVDRGALNSLQSVVLSYSVNGQNANDLVMQPSSDHGGFYEASLPQNVAMAPGEATVTFTVDIEPGNGQTNGPFTYVIDSIAPRFGALGINGHPQATVAEGSDVAWSLRTTDAGLLQDLDLTAIGNSAQQGIALPLAGDDHAASAPLALPRGTYDVRADVTDTAGNSASHVWPKALVVATAGIAMTDAGALLSAGATQASALPDGSLTATVLDGLYAVQVQLSTQKPFDGENAAVRLHHSITGSATPSSPFITLTSTDQGDSLLWTGTLPKTTWPVSSAGTQLSLLVESTGTRVPPRLAPSPPWSIHIDTSLPQVTNPTVNGGSSVVVRDDTPVTLSVKATDGDGPVTAVADVMSGSTVVATKEMLPNGNAFQANFLGGMGLADGVYDVRYTATDAAGHVAQTVHNDALEIDNAAPIATSLLLNGAPRLETRSNVPLDVDVETFDETASSVRIDFLHANGALAATVALTKESGAQWHATLPTGVNLPDGAYRARMAIKDDIGNTVSLEWPLSPLIVDNLAPQLHSSAVTYGGKTAARHGDTIHVVATLVESQTLGRIVARIGDEEVDLSGPAGSKTLQADLPAPWGNGTFVLGIDAGDLAGNRRLVSIPIMLDNTPPTIQLVEPRYVGGATSATLGEAIGVAVRAIDGLSEITAVLVDTTPANSATGSVQAIRQGTSADFLATFPSVQTGTFDLEVLIVDGAGNIRTGAVHVIIDRAGPTVQSPLVDGVSSLVLGNARSVTASVNITSARNLATVTATLLNSTGAQLVSAPMTFTSNQWRASLAVPNVEGAYKTAVSATDVDGRTDSVTPSQPNIVLDRTPPQLSNFRAVPLAESTATPPEGFFGDPVLFTLTVSDATALQGTMKATTASGNTLESALVRSGNQLTATLTILETGRITAAATVFDQAGNSNRLSTVLVQLPRGTAIPGVPNHIEMDTLPGGRLHFSWDLPTDGVELLGYTYAIDGTPPPRLGTQGNHVEVNAPGAGNHTFFIQAFATSGHIGPLAKYDFRTTAPAATTGTTTPIVTDTNTTVPESQTLSLERVRANLTNGRTVPITLSWLVAGTEAASVDCVEVQSAVGSGVFTPTGCQTGYSTRLFEGLPVEAGDVFHFRARWHTPTSVGPWQLVNATIPAEITWPTLRAMQTQPPVLMTHGNADGMKLLVLDTEGNVVAEATFDEEAGVWTASPGELAPGIYKTRLQAPDGQQASGPELTVQTTMAKAESGRGPVVAAILLTLVAVVGAAAVVYFFLRKRKTAPEPVAPREPGPGLGPPLVDEAIAVAPRKPTARVTRNGHAIGPGGTPLPAPGKATGKVVRAPVKGMTVRTMGGKPVASKPAAAKAPALPSRPQAPPSGKALKDGRQLKTGAYGTKHIPAR